MAVVNGGYLHNMDMKQFIKNLHLWSDFEIVSQSFPWVTLLKTYLQIFDTSRNMALINGGYLHYIDMKKFLKNLLL